MLEEDKSIYAKSISPMLQAGVIYVLMLIFNIFSYFASFTDLFMIKQGAPWVIFSSFLLFYALINSILSIAARDRNKYWLYSILSYAGLGLAGGTTAWLISGLTMDEAGTYRWILFIFTFGYVLLLSIVRAMRKIVTMAQKQDKRLRGEE
ncbi:MAG TPA: hypothetical protein PKC30_11865 [Saprospiraceae bacterium]|nr:hypothetical protein [Saprospiraceae bacterium]